MEKTIRIGKESVKVNNGMAWALYYNDQFGEDITSAFIPLAIGVINNIAGLLDLKEDVQGEVKTDDVIKLLSSDEATEAIFGLSTVGVTGFIKIFWALAKCADEEIPPPMEWTKRFGSCPLDTVAKDVMLFALEGFVSSKNWKRLGETIKQLQPTKNHSD